MTETSSLAAKTLDNETIFQELKRRSGGEFTGDQETLEKFQRVYEQLHDLANAIVDAYLRICKLYKLQPGKVDLVLGGGRAKGKPFKADSDLDLFFYVENPSQALDITDFSSVADPLDALDEKNMRMQRLIAEVSSICKSKNIKNDFHIMGYGGAKQDEYAADNQLLLARASSG